MEPAEQPGGSKPQSQGGLDESLGAEDVEKTLAKLEGMTSTLVAEVGKTPPESAAKTPPVEEPPPAAAAPVDETSPATEAPVAEAAPVEESAAPPAADEPVEEEAPVVEMQTPVAAAPAETGKKASPPGSADAEVEQELSQAIEQLQSGKSPGVGSAPVATPEAPVTKPRVNILRGLVRIVDLVFLPLAIVATVLDLPFRWLPAFARHVLGYLAMGTAFMAMVLWVYLLMFRGGQ